MYYQRFSNLIEKDNLDSKLVKKIDNYVAHLSISQSERINPVIVANSLDEQYSDVLNVFQHAVSEEHIFSLNYEVLCPNNGCILKSFSASEFDREDEFFEIECDICDENSHWINKEDVSVTYYLHNPLHKQNIFKNFHWISLFSKKKVNEIEPSKEIKCLVRDIREIAELNVSEEKAADIYLKNKEIEQKNKGDWIKVWLNPKTVWTILIGIGIIIVFIVCPNKKEWVLNVVNSKMGVKPTESKPPPVIINNNYITQPIENSSNNGPIKN